MKNIFINFVFPKINRVFILRMSISIIILIIILNYFFMPSFINGESMKPTYNSIGFNFATKYKYRYNDIKVGDIVVIKYVGKKYYLKRVVALSGDTVEFINGVLYVNDKPLDEPYLNGQVSDWNLEKRTVDDGYVYVVGDNRQVNINQHQFGQVLKSRIIGGVLW